MLRVVVCAQEPGSAPRFEVASVKLLEQRRPARARIDPGRVSYPFVTLGALIGKAYDAKNYQIDGPEWLGTLRYEVIAKIPEGVPPEQVPVMMQTLLAERFQLKVHSEPRIQPVYALLADPKGLKLKKSDDTIAPATSSRNGTPGPYFSFTSSGHFQLRRVTIAMFAEILSGSLGQPVLDRTGIQGEFDIVFDIDPGDLKAVQMLSVSDGAPVQSEPTASSIFSQMRALGLKLEAQKAAIQHIVVDHVEKVPTEN